MNDSAHLLIVDDDRDIRELLSEILTRYGYRVSTAHDAPEMARVLSATHIDLVVLDVMLPGQDGLSICRELRASSNLPVIMLTAMGETTDRIIGLEVGADDYLPKPFEARELVARIKAVLRRMNSSVNPETFQLSDIVSFAGWTLDLAKRQLKTPTEVTVDLTSGEFDLLNAFVEHPQRVLSRDQLLDLARGRNAAPFDRSIDVQVSRLRRKLHVESIGEPLIKTIRNGGYLFTPKVERV